MEETIMLIEVSERRVWIESLLLILFILLQTLFTTLLVANKCPKAMLNHIITMGAIILIAIVSAILVSIIIFIINTINT